MNEFFNKIKEAVFGTPEQQEKARKEVERRRVEKEVERLIERACDLGVKDFIGNFWNSLEHFPSWYKSKELEYKNLSISDVKDLGLEKRNGKEWKKLQITLKGKDYIFVFEEHDPPIELENTIKMGTLELYVDNRKVLALNMSESWDDGNGGWSSFGIDAFIEGRWVQDFKELYKEYTRISEEEYKKLGQEDPEKLKKNFGIE